LKIIVVLNSAIPDLLVSQIEASKEQFGGRSKELERAVQALDVSM
jgi:hypothetical protein